MTHAPLPHARAVQTVASVVEQERLATDTFRLRLRCPKLAARITPGQFAMLREPGRDDPLLGRPFALLDTFDDGDGRPAGIDVGYLVVGKMTGRMATLSPGDRVELWGPLGNGFPLPPTTGRGGDAAGGPLLMVAGGIGQTPFVAAGREALGNRTYGDRRPPGPVPVELLYGVRSADYAAGLSIFEAAGIPVTLATDDGSRGHHGFVTDLLAERLDGAETPAAVWVCGPGPMMAAAAALCRDAGVPCRLSLESPMACGFGACFSCVVKVRVDPAAGGDGWDYRRSCVEGPVFDAADLVL